MLDPIVKTIEVPCSQETAFNVFINEMDSWWPLDKFSVSAMSGGLPNELRISAELGGQIVEVTPEAKEIIWGKITIFDPHDLLGMDFHIPHPSEITDVYTNVNVRFTDLGGERTRVELTQDNWEALGDMAEMVHGGYGTGWVMIFDQAYKEACGG